MRKITIIGANSYIARNIIHVLKSKEENYVLYLYDQTEGHIDKHINYEKINIFDTDSVRNVNMQCDIIYMFVGKTGSANGFEEFDTFIDVNERALLNVLNEYRRQNSHAKIIFPSTRLVYKGKFGLLNENDEKEFKTIYAMNKFACENYLMQYHEVFDVQYCIFRICIPYGTFISNASSYGTAEFMINKAINGKNISIYGDGKSRRTLTYIGDLCNVLIKGAMCSNCVNDVYNIGGEDYSLKEMAELISRKYNVGIDFIPYPDLALKIESGNTVFDDIKLQSVCSIDYQMKFAKWCNQ